MVRRLSASLQDPDGAMDDPDIVKTMQLVIWELDRLGFRQELAELDLFLMLTVQVDLRAPSTHRGGVPVRAGASSPAIFVGSRQRVCASMRTSRCVIIESR